MPAKPTITPCPCGSHDSLAACCGRFLSGSAIPATAEQLMRSRYTAYTQANISYIQQTMRETAALNFDPIAAENWAKSVKWKRLKVLDAFPHPTDPNRAYVSFTAYYIVNGRPEEIREVSEFRRINERWFYINRLDETQIKEKK